MQVFRLERPFLGKGLSLGQRLGYLSSFYFYWTSVQKLFFLLIPVFCVATGVFPLLTEPSQYLEYFVPALVLNLIATITLQGGVNGVPADGTVQPDQAGLDAPGPERPGEPAGTIQGDSQVQERIGDRPASPALPGGGWAAGLFGHRRRVPDPQCRAGPNELWAYAVTVGFALFFLYLLVPVVALAFKRRELRTNYRFPQRLDLPLRVRMAGSDTTAWIDSYARNLNRFGLSITLDTGLVRHTDVDLEIRLPDRVVHAVASVRWASRLVLVKGTRFANGLRFDRISQDDQDAIARHLFWEIAPRHGEQLTMTHRSQQLATSAAAARVEAPLEV